MGSELPLLGTTGRVRCSTWRVGAVWLLFLSLIALLTTACERPSTPELLQVARVGPGLVEAGVDLEVVGRGFPEGRPAELRLSGVMSSPGREPWRVSFTLDGVARSAALIAAPLDEAALNELTGGAAHGTFRGSVRVQFDPQRAGAPALLGESGKVTIDFLLRSFGNEEAARRFGSFLGVSLDHQLTVKGLEPGSEAEVAGLQLGDRLLELDGVRLLSPSEFVPAPRGAMSRLLVVRPGYSGSSEVLVSRRGYLALDPLFALRAVLASLAVCLGLLLVARPPKVLVWLLRPQGNHRPEGSLGSPLSVGLLSLSAALLWTFIRLPGGFELDLVFLTFVGATLVVLSGFSLGGRRSPPARGFSLLGAISGALSSSLYLLPLLCALLYVTVTVGTLRLADVLRAQGLAPTTWLLVRSPWTVLLGAFSLAALVPRPGRRPPCEGIAWAGESLGLGRVLELSGVSFLLTLWVTVFLGGTAGADPQSFRAGLLLALKLGLAATGLSWARVRAGGIRKAEGFRLLGFGLIAGSFVSCAIGIALGSAPLGIRLGDDLRVFSSWLVVSLLLLFPLVALRSLSHHGRRTDPWI